ncbi:prolipoprotein diacylglyceryl transferase, partial [Kytococcus schroeteri]
DAATTVFGDVRINAVVSAVVFLAATALFVWWTVQQRKAEGVTKEEAK